VYTVLNIRGLLTFRVTVSVSRWTLLPGVSYIFINREFFYIESFIMTLQTAYVVNLMHIFTASNDIG